MPATSWTIQSVDPAGYMDSIPVPAPRFSGGTVVEDYFVDFLMEYGLTETFFVAPEPPGIWTELVGSSTAQTEMTVAATTWTELT